MEAAVTRREASDIARLALEIAKAQVGQREVPHNSNRGPMVDKYLAAVGLKPGYPWCQAFVNYCFEEAAKRLGVPEPVVNTGGVLDCWNRTPQHLKIPVAMLRKVPELIMPGDHFIMKVGTKGAGHTGIVVSVDRGWMTTIEGNTNDEGSREGYEVAIRKRSVTMKELVGIIRY